MVAVRPGELLVLRAPYMRALMRRTVLAVAAARHSDVHASRRRTLRSLLGREDAAGAGGGGGGGKDGSGSDGDSDGANAASRSMPEELRHSGEAIEALWRLAASQPAASTVAESHALLLQLRAASRTVQRAALGPRAAKRMGAVRVAAAQSVAPARSSTAAAAASAAVQAGSVLSVGGRRRGAAAPGSATSTLEMSPRVRSLWEAVTSGDPARLKRSALVRRHIAAAHRTAARRTESIQAWATGWHTGSAGEVPVRMLEQVEAEAGEGPGGGGDGGRVFPLATARLPFVAPMAGQTEEEAVIAAMAAGGDASDAAAMMLDEDDDLAAMAGARVASGVPPGSADAAAGPGGRYCPTGLLTRRAGVAELASAVADASEARLPAQEVARLRETQAGSLARYVPPLDAATMAGGEALLEEASGAPGITRRLRKAGVRAREGGGAGTGAAAGAAADADEAAGSAMAAQEEARTAAFVRLMDSEARWARRKESEREAGAGTPPWRRPEGRGAGKEDGGSWDSDGGAPSDGDDGADGSAFAPSPVLRGSGTRGVLMDAMRGHSVPPLRLPAGPEAGTQGQGQGADEAWPELAAGWSQPRGLPVDNAMTAAGASAGVLSRAAAAASTADMDHAGRGGEAGSGRSASVAASDSLSARAAAGADGQDELSRALAELTEANAGRDGGVPDDAASDTPSHSAMLATSVFSGGRGGAT